MSAIVGLTALARVMASPATCLASPRPEATPPTAQMPVPASYGLSRVRATSSKRPGGFIALAEYVSRIEMTVRTDNR